MLAVKDTYMNEIHDMSRRIGALEAGVDGLKEGMGAQHKEMSTKLDKVLEKIEAMSLNAVKAENRLRDVEEGVEDWNSWRNKGLLALIGLPFVSSLGGNKLGAFIEKLFGP